MIGNKLILLKRGQISNVGNTHKILVEIPDLDEVKHFTSKNFRKYGYITLVNIIRFYVRASHILRQKYEQIKIKTKEKINKYFPKKVSEVTKKEASGFIKMMSDYKNKIREIKDKIVEEENRY
ncbi:MAG: hypothetical protein WAV10_02350 [Minisyncoccia bacterium]